MNLYGRENVKSCNYSVSDVSVTNILRSLSMVAKFPYSIVPKQWKFWFCMPRCQGKRRFRSCVFHCFHSEGM